MEVHLDGLIIRSISPEGATPYFSGPGVPLSGIASFHADDRFTGQHHCECGIGYHSFIVVMPDTFYGPVGKRMCQSCVQDAEIRVLLSAPLDDLPLYLGYKFLFQGLAVSTIKRRLSYIPSSLKGIEQT